jgi:hypothetical protein
MNGVPFTNRHQADQSVHCSMNPVFDKKRTAAAAKVLGENPKIVPTA